jgi:hypothetical protein
MIRSVRVDAVDGDVATFLGVEDVASGRLVSSSGKVVEQFGETIGAQIVYRVQKRSSGDWIVIAGDLLSVEGGGTG